MESVKEEHDTPLVEYDNQQQIFIWVRNNLKLPSVQGQTYKVWDIHQYFEDKILEKSSYYDILEKCGVPNSTIAYLMNVIFPP